MAPPGQAAAWSSSCPFAIILGDLLFPDPDADEAPAEEDPGVPGELKVGDKIVTTGGIYGQITRVNDKSVQVQVADRVRIEIVARGGRRLPGAGSGRAGIGAGR